MKLQFPKKLLSAAISFVVALSSVTGITAADDNPTLQFRNEKVTGLTVTKNIYRKSSDTQPLRKTDSEFYEKNELAGDEFRLYLLEGASETDVSPKSGEQYKRMNQYGNYYCCPLSDKTLIIRPTANDYEVYYYDSSGKHIEDKPHNSKASDLAERFKADYEITSQVTKYFSTGIDGEFYLYDSYDGDQVYFKKLKSTYYYVTEDISLLDSINDEKINFHKTGVYKTDSEALTTPNPALFFDVSDANLFEVKNCFDKPNDVFTLKKTINYFGSSDLLNEEFTFELLINDENPGGYSYVKYDGDSVIAEGSFDYGAVSEPAVIKLKGSQRIEIEGIMKNTFIEVRELITDADGNKLNPYYSPLTVSSIADGKSYTLVKDGSKEYVKWEGNYIKNSVDKAEYINVPNVMSISKTVANTQELSDYEDYEFEFHVLKWDGSEYRELAENEQLRYYLRKGLGTPYGDSSKNGSPFITDNGNVRLHHGETALFIGLEADEKFKITETGAFYQGSSVTADFKMDTQPYEKTARPKTVTNAVTQTSEGEVRNFKNTYNQMLGLSVTKVVEDDFGRSNPNAEYQFKLMKEDTSTTPSTFKTVQFDGKITITINDKVQNVTSAEDQTLKNSGDLVFTLKKGETANITKLSNGTYKVVEVNPNTHTGGAQTDPNPQNEPHLFITDVLVNGGDTQTYNKPVNGDANPNLTDITSEQFVLNVTESRSVTFTNKVRELKYYFDVEKVIFVDKNIHDSDSEQKFVFKVERFAEGLTEAQLTDDKLLECFYVTINCDKALTYPVDPNTYHYTLYTDDDKNGYPYSEFQYDNTSGVKIKKTYEVNSQNECYRYPAAICYDRETVMVKKKGIYRISEIKEWSSTDYDFWRGSNVYKGYKGDKQPIAEKGNDGYVIFSVTDMKADLFKSESAEIEGRTEYRPTASFTNSETEFEYLNSQSYAENKIKRN